MKGKMEGPWEYYWPNGNLLYIGKFREGSMGGYTVYYHSDGTINEKLTGNYTNGED